MSFGFRNAAWEDLPAIVALLADDELGQGREYTGAATRPEMLPRAYLKAFEAIDADPYHELIVATDEADAVIGVAHLTFLPSLTHGGSLRAQIEGVRVSSSRRGLGLGEALIKDMIDRASARGCRIVQLTTDRRRPRALAFYEKLGFRGTHVGLKLHLAGTAHEASGGRRETMPIEPAPQGESETLQPEDDARSREGGAS